MRDMLTLDRIQIEYNQQAPFIVVGAPQAARIRELLNFGEIEFEERTHQFSDDVMFSLPAEANTVYIQSLLDQVE